MGLLSFFYEKRNRGIFRMIPLDCTGSLFTSPMPTGAYDRGKSLLKIYTQNQIDHVFPLVTDSEIELKARSRLLSEYEKRNMTCSRYIIKDYTAPSTELLQALVEEAVSLLKKGSRIAVHCHAGVGRTSLAVACIAMAVNGLNPEEAVEYIKSNMMVNLTDEQINRIKDFKY